MTTGYYANLFYMLKNYVVTGDTENKWNEIEHTLLTGMLVLLFLLLTLVEFKRHQIQSHQHYITKDQFKDKFVQFKDLKKPDRGRLR